MVKKLRYYARYIVVCLLLNKMDLVKVLVKVWNSRSVSMQSDLFALWFEEHDTVTSSSNTASSPARCGEVRLGLTCTKHHHLHISDMSINNYPCASFVQYLPSELLEQFERFKEVYFSVCPEVH